MAFDSTAVRVSVSQLLAEYAVRVDSADIDGIAELFTADALFAVEAREYRGRPAIRDFFGRGGPIGIHLGAQAAVRIDDGGTSASVVQNFFFLRDGSDATVRGVYRDLVRVEGNGWRFVERRIEIRPAAGA